MCFAKIAEMLMVLQNALTLEIVLQPHIRPAPPFAHITQGGQFRRMG